MQKLKIKINKLRKTGVFFQNKLKKQQFPKKIL